MDTLDSCQEEELLLYHLRENFNQACVSIPQISDYSYDTQQALYIFKAAGIVQFPNH